MTRKVLIIGIDGGTWTVLKPAMEQGYMPFLKSLVDNGASGILESTIPAITPAAWGTFQTGRNPGANGVYGFSCFDRQTKKFSPVNSTYLQKTLWQILSDAGRQVISLNVPMTYPPQPVNGYVISGILTPSIGSNFTYPKEFKEELLSKFPEYQILNFNKIKKIYPGDPKIKEFINTLLKVVDVHTQTACYLLKKNNWDVFMVHFQETDVLQHMTWKFLDPTHPDYDVSKRNYIFSTFFHRLDEQIKKIDTHFKQRNPNSTIMVVSDHGFESHFRRFNLGNWLVDNRHLKLKQTLFKNFRTKKNIDQVYNRLETIVPNKVRIELRKFIFPIHELINWDKTSAFSVCSGGEGFIYILEEKESVKHELAMKLQKELTKITDPINSQKIIKQVHLNNELYSGDKTHLLPDLIIEPADGYSITGLYQLGKNYFSSVNSKDTIQIGKHHKDGVIVTTGHGIKPSNKLRLKLVDIVPTLLYYLEVHPPAVLDGSLCLDLFNASFVETTPILDANTSHDIEKRGSLDVYSPEEQNLINKRLKDLGYL